MFRRTQFSSAALALAVMLAGGQSDSLRAATGHAHRSEGGAAIGMMLNNGQKWQTDAALRKGMAEIRATVAVALPRIHHGQFAPGEFSALADRVQEQIDDMVAQCKLPEDADLQLHLVLAEILGALATMRGEGGQELGAPVMIEALNAYGEHFDHPGWEPLAH
jgi:hypothetical protein